MALGSRDMYQLQMLMLVPILNTKIGAFFGFFLFFFFFLNQRNVGLEFKCHSHQNRQMICIVYAFIDALFLDLAVGYFFQLFFIWPFGFHFCPFSFWGLCLVFFFFFSFFSLIFFYVLGQMFYKQRQWASTFPYRPKFMQSLTYVKTTRAHRSLDHHMFISQICNRE